MYLRFVSANLLLAALHPRCTSQLVAWMPSHWGHRTPDSNIHLEPKLTLTALLELQAQDKVLASILSPGAGKKELVQTH